MSSEQTFIPPHPLQTPVLFLIFNRLDTTVQVFEAIRKAKPPRFYVAADGPRSDREGEAEKVKAVRDYVLSNVDWQCEVKTLFRDKNLGCKYAVSKAITWFFEQEEMGIILEDDCLPSQSFFWFCEELLTYYKNDERVSVVTGDNFQAGHLRGNSTYYFSKYNHCWGWATWRRVWQYYQGDVPFWPEWQHSDDWRIKTPDPVERRYWEKIFDQVYADQIDTWDYPWTASVWRYGGLTATPNVNLVSNIGFNKDATHTTSNSSILAAIPASELGELCHPTCVLHDEVADRFTFDHAFGGAYMRIPKSLFLFPKRIVGKLYHLIKK